MEKLRQVAKKRGVTVPGSQSQTPTATATPTAPQPQEAQKPLGAVSLNPYGGGMIGRKPGASEEGSIHLSPTGRPQKKPSATYRMEEARSEHEKKLRDLFGDKRLDTKNKLYNLAAQRAMHESQKKNHQSDEWLRWLAIDKVEKGVLAQRKAIAQHLGWKEGALLDPYSKSRSASGSYEVEGMYRQLEQQRNRQALARIQQAIRA